MYHLHYLESKDSYYLEHHPTASHVMYHLHYLESKDSYYLEHHPTAPPLDDAWYYALSDSVRSKSGSTYTSNIDIAELHTGPKLALKDSCYLEHHPTAPPLRTFKTSQCTTIGPGHCLQAIAT
jgi:hypothetical protein